MSPIIYEVLGVGTGITDTQGRLVSSGAGIPTFVGVLDKTAKVIVERYGDSPQDGDIFIANVYAVHRDDRSFGGNDPPAIVYVTRHSRVMSHVFYLSLTDR